MDTNITFTLQRINHHLGQNISSVKAAKYILLYRAIKNCIIRKEIPTNWKLPSTRLLSKELNISRTTVIEAYELLLLEKLITAKQGSGYRVNISIADKDLLAPKNSNFNLNNFPPISEKGKAFLENFKLLNRQRESALAFKPGIPPIDIFPINKWKNLQNNYWRYIRSNELSYGQASGVLLLKEQISGYLKVSRNIHCDPSQVIVVSGSLQSLYLISNAIINKGDSVALEDPTFPNVHSIFKSISSRMHPVKIDNEGLDLNSLKKISRYKPKLLHLTPSDHYPLGIKMSLKRRLDILEWASENKTLVIENDYEHEVANHLQSLPTIFSLDKEGRTIYLGTFNRLLFPSIRLGFMVVPKHLVTVLEALQEHSHRFVSTLTQLVMGQFIEKNYLYKHLEDLIAAAKQRADVFSTHFMDGNKKMLLLTHPFNSLHKVAVFNEKVGLNKEMELLKLLSKNEIAAFSLSKCYIEQAPQTGLILGYSTVRPTLIKQKVQQMNRLINDF